MTVTSSPMQGHLQELTVMDHHQGTETAFMAWSRRKSIVSALIFVAAATLLVILANVRDMSPLAPKAKLALGDIPFNGEQAFKHLTAICAIGPRVSGTKGMQEQQNTCSGKNLSA